MRKKSREDDVIELDADDGAPRKGPTPAPPVAPAAPPAPVSGRVSGEARRGTPRGATPRGSSSAPRRNPPRVSATERDLTIKLEPRKRKMPSLTPRPVQTTYARIPTMSKARNPTQRVNQEPRGMRETTAMTMETTAMTMETTAMTMGRPKELLSVTGGPLMIIGGPV